MKKTTIIIVLILLSAIGFSQEFLGIPVGGNRQDVVNKFIAKGFKVYLTPSNIVTSMKGKVNNEIIELLIVNTPLTKKVWKFSVYMPKKTTWDDLKSNYNYYVRLFTNKYGEPNSSYDNFISPYYEGDGYEMSAVKLEKTNYVTFWDSMYVEISEYQQVGIHYENSENASINRAERDKLNMNTF